MAETREPVEPESDPGDPRLVEGRSWADLCQALARASHRVLGEGVPDAPRDRAEGFRYLTRFLAAGIAVCVEHADPDDPVFVRMIDHKMKWGLDAPDCLYLYASVKGGARYRIHGHRGSANHIDIQVNFGHFAQGDIASWGTIASVGGDELRTADDGSFELVLAAEPRSGNWLRLGPDAEFVLVRQYFADWENERPADLVIERLDGEGPIAPPRTDRMAARLDGLATWIERGGALWEQMSRGLLGMPANTLVVHRPEAGASDRAGMAGQAYGMGNFACGPDEAVILSFRPPACRHWSVSLANYYWESLDYESRQSSLNHHQARLDRDGVFRGVIAHRDPGVANWLDTAGHERGTLALRFLLAAEAPAVEARVVPWSRVRDALPPDTATVDPDERARRLARRRRAVWRRFRR
jgi:hypothetical protein